MSVSAVYRTSCSHCHLLTSFPRLPLLSTWGLPNRAMFAHVSPAFAPLVLRDILAAPRFCWMQASNHDDFFFWQFCSTAVAGGQSWQPHCDDQILGQSHMKPENPKVANPRNKVQNQCVVSHPCNCRMSNRPLHLQDEVWTHHTSHSKVHRGGHFPTVY